MDFVTGVITTLIACVALLVAFKVGGDAALRDVKYQCKKHGSASLVMLGEEYFFYCAYEPPRKQER